MTEALRVLLVEDSPTDAKLVLAALRTIGRPIDHERVQHAATMEAALERQTWDVILSDWSMPGFSALAALDIARRLGPDLPFIIVSGTIGEEAAVDAMRAGAHDYVLKDKLARLVPAVERELRESKVRVRRKQVEEALRVSEARFKCLWDSGIVFISITDMNARIVDVNDAGAAMLGHSRDELLSSGVRWRELTPPGWGAVDDKAVAQLKASGVATPLEKEFLRKDGSRLPILASAAMLDDSAVILIGIDLTERRRAEAAVHAEQARIQALVENSADGITLNTREASFAYVSPAAARIFGCPANDLIGQNIIDYTHPDDREEALDVMRRVREVAGATLTTTHRVVRKDGASRWVEITRTNRLDDPAVAGVVCNLRDITDRKLAEEALAVARDRFAVLVESGLVGIIVAEGTGRIVEANDAFLDTVGYSRDDLRAGLSWASLTPPEWARFNAAATDSLRNQGVARPWEKEYLRKDGSRVPVLVGVARLSDGRNISVSIDLSERKRAEAGRAQAEQALRHSEDQLRQAQKMEAVGRLAGGVAHDFNNVLSVILSYADLIMGDLKANDPMRADMDEIRKAGLRAAGLTRQLLLFSRQQVVEPKVIDLQDVLEGMDKMLQRILGEDVELVSVPSKTIGRVKVDPSHVEQVILNLVVNARDAMPTGGKLTIETANVVLDEQYALTHLPAKAGPHVMLAVSDTGTGMDRATQARIFEPFFTTKEKGKGTGLGLSTVFGIVQQSGGNIWVYSEPGKGTTFKVYLPRVDAEVDVPMATVAPATLRGTETVLLVEDEEQVRTIVLSILRRQGYRVLVAQNAGEALLLCEKHAEAVDLLLTDVVMPQMSGPELASRLVATRPEMKVLCMSGYTDDSIVRHGVLDSGVAFIQKPVTPDSLARKVREVLDNGRGTKDQPPKGERGN
jgi:two-component system, cell cycle sensor histidine kinase and response regulator CckA